MDFATIFEQIGLERARQRGELDRIEQEQLAFFQRTRQKYLQIAQSEPGIAIIDASQALGQVQQGNWRDLPPEDRRQLRQQMRVLDAVDVLHQTSADNPPLLGRRVVVYGGGNTAM